MEISRERIVMVLIFLMVAEGCDLFSSSPRLSTETEAIVMERWLTAPPGEAENLWEEMDEILGPAKSISFEELLEVTGYEMKKPLQVECRIWKNSHGEWLAVAYEPERKSISVIKSHMRR